MNDTDTPRTDKEAFFYRPYSSEAEDEEWVQAGLCRDIERELAAVTKDLLESEAQRLEWVQRCTSYADQLRQVRAREVRYRAILGKLMLAERWSCDVFTGLLGPENDGPWVMVDHEEIESALAAPVPDCPPSGPTTDEILDWLESWLSKKSTIAIQEFDHDGRRMFNRVLNVIKMKGRGGEDETLRQAIAAAMKEDAQ